VTGVSGSGKSSLVFDTVYAEGQRRYVETFSPYARSSSTAWTSRRSIASRASRPRSRSTDESRAHVPLDRGTMTELNDHLKLLYARAARLHCSGCGQPCGATRPTASRSSCARARPRPATAAKRHLPGRDPEELQRGRGAPAPRGAGLHAHPRTRRGPARGRAGPLPRRRCGFEPRARGARGRAARGARGAWTSRSRTARRGNSPPTCTARAATSTTATPCRACSRSTRRSAPARPAAASAGDRRGLGPRRAGRHEIAARRRGASLADPVVPRVPGRSRPVRHASAACRSTTPWRELGDEHRRWVIEGEGHWDDGVWYGARRFFRLAREQGVQDAHPRAAVEVPQLRGLLGLQRRAAQPEALLWRLGADDGPAGSASTTSCCCPSTA